MIRSTVGVFLMLIMIGAIGYIFWTQEMKYWLPTPVPANLKLVQMGDTVVLDRRIAIDQRPLFLHFYNFDCPCSRFNVDEFRSMIYKYRDSINFVAIVQSSSPEPGLDKKFQKLIGTELTTFVDFDGELAKALGVYATPQALIITPTRTVFYTGNYNASRYCTSRSTKFAEMALHDVLAGAARPRFADQPLDLPYGCLIPAYEAENQIPNFASQ